MKIFEKFIEYLCMVGVLFALLYVVLPASVESILNQIGLYAGPVILVGLLLLAWRKTAHKVD